MELLLLPIEDIIAIIILMTGAWSGYRKGFVVSIASFIAIIAGGFGAFHFSDLMGDLLIDYFNLSATQIEVASFAITFLIVVTAVHLLAKTLEKMLKMVALGLVNKIGGAGFGLMKNATILSLIIYGVNAFNGVLPEDLGEDCIVYPHVQAIAPAIMPYWKDRSSKTTLQIFEDKIEEKAEELSTKLGK